MGLVRLKSEGRKQSFFTKPPSTSYSCHERNLGLMNDPLLVILSVFVNLCVVVLIFWAAKRRDARAIKELQIRASRVLEVLSEEELRVPEIRNRYRAKFSQDMPLQDFYLLLDWLVNGKVCSRTKIGTVWEEGERRVAYAYSKRVASLNTQ